MLTLGKCLEKVLHAGVECATGAMKKEVLASKTKERKKRKRNAKDAEEFLRFFFCVFRVSFASFAFTS
jgi:hypothetical protein